MDLHAVGNISWPLWNPPRLDGHNTAVDDGCQTPESEAVLVLQAYLWRFCFIALSNEYRN